jgi:hypothetical protein
MLEQYAAKPRTIVAVDRSPRADRSMQVLEYVVASIAVIAAVVLTFLR